MRVQKYNFFPIQQRKKWLFLKIFSLTSNCQLFKNTHFMPSHIKNQLQNCLFHPRISKNSGSRTHTFVQLCSIGKRTLILFTIHPFSSLCIVRYPLIHPLLKKEHFWATYQTNSSKRDILYKTVPHWGIVCIGLQRMFGLTYWTALSTNFHTNTKKAGAFASAFYIRGIDYYIALTFFWSLDFRLAALFLWITERFASLSMMETILGSLSIATCLSSRARKSRRALRMVLA